MKIGMVAFNEAGPFQAGLTRLERLYKHCARAGWRRTAIPEQ